MVVVDECRATGGGVADAIVADLAEHRIGRRLGSVRAVDSFVPLGPSTAAVLVGVDQIVAAAVASVTRRRRQAAARPLVSRAAVAFPGAGLVRSRLARLAAARAPVGAPCRRAPRGRPA